MERETQTQPVDKSGSDSGPTGQELIDRLTVIEGKLDQPKGSDDVSSLKNELTTIKAALEQMGKRPAEDKPTLRPEDVRTLLTGQDDEQTEAALRSMMTYAGYTDEEQEEYLRAVAEKVEDDSQPNEDGDVAPAGNGKSDDGGAYDDSVVRALFTQAYKTGFDQAGEISEMIGKYAGDDEERKNNLKKFVDLESRRAIAAYLDDKMVRVKASRPDPNWFTDAVVHGEKAAKDTLRNLLGNPDTLGPSKGSGDDPFAAFRTAPVPDAPKRGEKDFDQKLKSRFTAATLKSLMGSA